MRTQNLTIIINPVNRIIEALNIKVTNSLKSVGKNLEELGRGAGYALRR